MTAPAISTAVIAPGPAAFRLDLAWLSLFALILVHAAWSQPAPIGLGPAEITIGMLLLLLCGWRQPLAVASAVGMTAVARPWDERLLIGLFLALLWTGGLRAAAASASIDEVIRDLVPFAFLFLCLLMTPSIRAGVPILLMASICSIAGALFALRFFIWTELPLHLWGQVSHPTGLNYLANSPLVSFAACFGPVWLVLRPSTLLRRPLLSLGLLAAALLAWAALAATTQRAPLGFSLVVLCIGPLLFALRAGSGHVSRSDALVALAVGLPMLVIIMHLANTIGPDFIEKTRLVGGNARLAEWSAVWHMVAAHPSDLIWGRGWGAKFASPAVGNYQVGYTHGLAPYLLFKLGLVGLIGLVVWLGVMGRWLLLSFQFSALSAAIALATLPTFMTTLMFSTSYKHLGFGLLLVLICAAAARADRPSQSA